jgi:hypothetical protein
LGWGRPIKAADGANNYSGAARGGFDFSVGNPIFEMRD